MSNGVIDCYIGASTGYPLIPVGWWKLNETSGTVAADSSGNGYDGTYSATAAHASAISTNSTGCLDSTGTAGSGNGYVSIGLQSALNVGDAPPWAVAVTLKIDNLGATGIGGHGTKDVFVNYGSVASGFLNWGISLDASDDLYGDFTKLNTVPEIVQTSSPLGLTAVRAMLVHTGADLKLYVAGALANSTPTAAQSWPGGADGIVIGRGFDGKCSDAMVFDYAPSLSEITVDAAWFS